MIEELEQEVLFKKRCSILFGKMYGCSVEMLAYVSDYSFDYLVHAKDCNKYIKCIYSDAPVDFEFIKEMHSITVGSNAEYVIITNGKFTQEAMDGRRNFDSSLTLIDGEACTRLFYHYSVIPQTGGYNRQTGYADNTQYQDAASGYVPEEPSFRKRLLAVLASLIIPGSGCFLHFCFTGDKRYIPLAVLFFAVSFILLQFLGAGNAIFLLVILVYLISISVSFITLDKRINDRIRTEKRLRTSFVGTVLSIFIPGAGAAILYYLNRNRKHILYGNMMFWISFVFVFLIDRTEFNNYLIAAIVVIQLWTVVYTARNLDEDLKQPMRIIWKSLLSWVKTYFVFHMSRR